MKYFAMVAAVAAALIGGATARDCTPGLYYCGHVLTEIGDYDAQLMAASNGRPLSQAYHSRFYCTGGSNGEIVFVTYCNNGCIDNGVGNNDTCA